MHECVSDVGGGNVQAESLGSDERNAQRLSLVCWCCAVVFTVVVVHPLHAALCISCKSRITSRPPCLISPPFLPRKSGVRPPKISCSVGRNHRCLLAGWTQPGPSPLGAEYSILLCRNGIASTLYVLRMYSRLEL